jgi:chromate transporter
MLKSRPLDARNQENIVREYPNERTSYWGSQWEIIKSFLVFGCVSFGGPQVHITMMHEEFVMKRKWIDDNMFSELLGIGQSIPGPTSSQMVTAIGAIRGRGFLGGLLAFACFQLPGAVVMILAALASDMLDSYLQTPPWWIRGIERGLANSAVALVAISVLRLGSKLVVTKFQKALCVVGNILNVIIFTCKTFLIHVIINLFSFFIIFMSF